MGVDCQHAYTVRQALTPADSESKEMAKKFPVAPAHPERLCWGCDLYCPADDLRCGNGADRTPHPCEFWGDDWEQMLEGTTSETTAMPEVAPVKGNPPPASA